MLDFHVNDRKQIDDECVLLCAAINRIDGLRTVESCCGHNGSPMRIWFEIDDIKFLPILLYYIDACHVGFSWDCIVTTDCGMSPAMFRIESKDIGEEAYAQANIIAQKIENYFRDNEDPYDI